MKRVARIAVVVLLWAPIFALVDHVASGLTPADLPAFDMGAKATAVQWTFNSPSLGIPAEPTGELDLSHSEVTLKSGPAAYALGSVLWPGQVAAGLPSFLQSEIESQSGGQFKFPFPVPNYPIRAESFYPQGPTSAGSQTGTLVMRSSAHADSTDAASSINSFGIPGIASVGTQASTASNGFDPDGAVSMVNAAANDISLAGGVVKIRSVVTNATARSDGDKGKVAGTTSVLGAFVAGHAVTIDSSGVHVEGQGIGTAAAQQAVNQVLKQAGLSIELASPVDTLAGAQASRALSGLIVRYNDALVDKLVSLLPTNVQESIRNQVTFDQEVTVAFAPAVVSTSAAKAVPFPSFGPIVGGDTSGSVPPVIETARGGDSGAVGSSGSAPSISSPGSSQTTIVAAPVALKNFTGIPVPLIIMLLLLAFATARPLMAAADRVLFSKSGGTNCPEGLD